MIWQVDLGLSIRLYKPRTREYLSNAYDGDHEIAALTGNITEMDGKPYLHLHIVIADEENRCFGGHLTSAVISATAEIFVRPVDAELDRSHEPGIGLNLLAIS